MAVRLRALCWGAREPRRLAAFWAGLLEREVGEDGATVLPADEVSFELRFVPDDRTKDGPNQLHFDLPSATDQQQAETVTRVLALGGDHLDIGQGEVDHVVMQDPEGNEMCVIEPGNNFLAGTGTIGCLSSDGSRAAGEFWSAALGWPLVWDEGEETAIQSPAGGPKISWGGPPFPDRPEHNRLWLELVADDLAPDVDRLVALGASVRGEVPGGVELADPDGNELVVVNP